MDFAQAPFYRDVPADVPAGRAYWAETSDKKRVRLAAWGQDATKGTVLLFPGRTEYIEKYGFTAAALAERGFATLAIDWRGQGLADRMLGDPLVGHVLTFPDYQKDVAAMIKVARALDLPKPWFLLGHSMGGCIGLRSLHEGLPVKAAAFTGPMWGIRIAPQMQPLAWALGRLMPALGQGHRMAPGTQPTPYVLAVPFDDNMLTTDREMWDMMCDQLAAHPDLSLGGPSFLWLREALAETADLAEMPSPKVSCLTFLGTRERIVHTGRIHTRMGTWANGTLEMVDGAEHEVLMENATTRNQCLDMMAARFLHAAG